MDECAGLDGADDQPHLDATRLSRPENTLHDLRWGDDDERHDEITSGSSRSPAPSRRRTSSDGYAGAVSERQPPMYFRLGGGTIKGISKPGEIVWSRIYVDDGKLKMDLGRAKVVELPPEETERRWQVTTPQWPIMHAVTYGVSRDQMMAQHKANHIQVAYCPDAAGANTALAAKAAAFRDMGIDVSVCGDQHGLS